MGDRRVVERPPAGPHLAFLPPAPGLGRDDDAGAGPRRALAFPGRPRYFCAGALPAFRLPAGGGEGGGEGAPAAMAIAEASAMFAADPAHPFNPFLPTAGADAGAEAEAGGTFHTWTSILAAETATTPPGPAAAADPGRLATDAARLGPGGGAFELLCRWSAGAAGADGVLAEEAVVARCTQLLHGLGAGPAGAVQAELAGASTSSATPGSVGSVVREVVAAGRLRRRVEHFAAALEAREAAAPRPAAGSATLRAFAAAVARRLRAHDRAVHDLPARAATARRGNAGSEAAALRPVTLLELAVLSQVSLVPAEPFVSFTGCRTDTAVAHTAGPPGAAPRPRRALRLLRPRPRPRPGRGARRRGAPGGVRVGAGAA